MFHFPLFFSIIELSSGDFQLRFKLIYSHFEIVIDFIEFLELLIRMRLFLFHALNIFELEFIHGTPFLAVFLAMCRYLLYLS